MKALECYKADMPVLSEKEQMELVASRNIGERAHLARRKDLSKKIAKILVTDPELKVRYELAVHTNHQDIWKQLSKKDISPKVRKMAKQNIYFGRQK